jgi:hypothetical protein
MKLDKNIVKCANYPFCPWMMQSLWGEHEETGMEISNISELRDLSSFVNETYNLEDLSSCHAEFAFKSSLFPIPYVYNDNPCKRRSKTSLSISFLSNNNTKVSTQWSEPLSFDTPNVTQVIDLKPPREIGGKSSQVVLSINTATAKAPFGPLTTIVTIIPRWTLISKFHDHVICVRQYVPGSEADVHGLQKGKASNYPYRVLWPYSSYNSWYWADTEAQSYKSGVIQLALEDDKKFPLINIQGEKLKWSGPVCINGIGEYSLMVYDPKREEYPHIVHINISIVCFVFIYMNNNFFLMFLAS